MVDTTGAVSDLTLTELTETGFFRLLQPAWCGGLEAEPQQYYDLAREIAGPCGSTGWLAAVLGVCQWHLALFDERAQRDVWSKDPRALVCSAYAPVGQLHPVRGGFELSGRWRFASGSGHAGWALLGGAVVADGKTVDIVVALVPCQDLRVDRVWDAVGLRGTASDDLYAERVFVPNYRILRNYDVALRRGPGQDLNSGPLYRMPFGTMFSNAVTAPVIGIAEGCLELFLARMREDNRLTFGGSAQPADQHAQVSLARAASEIDAATLQLNRNLGDIYTLARRREEIPIALRLRARRDQALGTERAVRAIDLVFAAAGGMSLPRGNPIERAWRDAHTGTVHAANDVEAALALYGRGAFGLPVDDTLV